MNLSLILFLIRTSFALNKNSIVIILIFLLIILLILTGLFCHDDLVNFTKNLINIDMWDNYLMVNYTGGNGTGGSGTGSSGTGGSGTNNSGTGNSGAGSSANSNNASGSQQDPIIIEDGPTREEWENALKERERAALDYEKANKKCAENATEENKREMKRLGDICDELDSKINEWKESYEWCSTQSDAEDENEDEDEDED